MIKEEIFDDMIYNIQRFKEIDPWVPGEEKAYRTFNEKSQIVEYSGFTFIIMYTRGGGAGMGQYPPLIKIQIKEEFSRKTNPELFL